MFTHITSAQNKLPSMERHQERLDVKNTDSADDFVSEEDSGYGSPGTLINPSIKNSEPPFAIVCFLRK